MAPEYVMWKQRDGTEIRVVDMDDRHLYNTIRMCERGAEARCKRAELAQHSMDPDDVLFDYLPDQFYNPVYKTLVAVAISRGIKL